MPGAATSSRTRLVLALVVAVLPLVVYAQTAGFDFISLDDPRYVSHNPFVAPGLTAEGVRWAFANESYATNWHPLTWLSHMLDASLFGAERPGPQHTMNVLLHVAAGIVLFLALERLTGAPWPAAFVAAAFAVHPLHVESVAWISERKDVLSGLLWMLTMWAWAAWRDRGGKGRYALVLAAFALGLMAKPTLVTLPCALLLLDAWPLARLGKVSLRELVGEKLPLFALTAASCFATLGAQRDAMYDVELLSLPYRAANAVVAYALYVVKTVWPVGLAPFYPHSVTPGQTPLSATTVTAAAAFLLALTGSAALAWRRGHRYPMVGFAWFIGTMVPMIGLVQVGSAALADRYHYIPSIGLFIILAWGSAETAAARTRPRLAVGAGAVLLAIWTVLAYRQTARWHDDYPLFRHTVAVTENNALAHTLLGVAELRRGERAAAKENLARAAAIDPGEADARYHLARAHAADGEYREALIPLTELLRLDGGRAATHLALGEAYLGAGMARKGVSHLERSLEGATDPADAAAAHRLLAQHAAETGNLPQAARHYRWLAESEPDDPWALNNLAWLSATHPALGDPEAAVELARRACRLSDNRDPSHLDTLAAAYAAGGDYARAIETANRALGLVGADDTALRAEIESHRERFRNHEPIRSE